MRISNAEKYNITTGRILKNTNNHNRYNSCITKPQSFCGNFDTASKFLDVFFNILNKFFNLLDKNAMIQVSFVDTVSTNIPRTLVDLRTSLAAALETFRREFSGLFVNCLMPGFIVKGVASLLPKSDIFKGTNIVNSWANGNSIDKLKDIYKNAYGSGSKDVTKEFVKTALSSISGLDGTKWIEYKSVSHTQEFNNAVEDIAKAVNLKGNEREKLLISARECLAKLTKAENILQFNGKPHTNLEETLRDIADLGSKFNTVKDGVKNPKEFNIVLDKYCESLKNFVNKKSRIGLGIVIAIAVSIQSINRAITRKQFKSEGAPIYKDFGKKDTTEKMDEKQKKKFFLEKLVSAIGMYALAGLSMMKKPTSGMFQFSGIFPTIDQCRWIAASTFASRMLAAEDRNELRETRIRELASFSGLYFLGDYVKKGAASIIEAISNTKTGQKLIGEKVILLNRQSKFDGKEKSYWQQFSDWVKNTDLKTTKEVSNIKVRNLRNLCRVIDISFAIAMLGILLPSYTRKKTEENVAKAKRQEKLLAFSAVKYTKTSNIFNDYNEVFKNKK